MSKQGCLHQIDWASICFTIILGFFGWALYIINEIHTNLKQTQNDVIELKELRGEISNIVSKDAEILLTTRTIQAMISQGLTNRPLLQDQESLPKSMVAPSKQSTTHSEQLSIYDPEKLAEFSVRNKIPQPQYNLILKNLNKQSKEKAKINIESIIPDQEILKKLFEEIN